MAAAAPVEPLLWLAEEVSAAPPKPVTGMLFVAEAEPVGADVEDIVLDMVELPRKGD